MDRKFAKLCEEDNIGFIGRFFSWPIGDGNRTANNVEDTETAKPNHLGNR